MDISELVPYIETLEDKIDDLEDALEPILSGSLTETAGRLPLLDKAQLYVLVTYAIESILFSYLRLNGINAKEHPVFRELTRVKQYFEKVKKAEAAGESVTPVAQLDRAAAGRFIKHGLAGNDKYDQRLSKQLEDRKLALQKEIAAHKAKHESQDQASADQGMERNIAAKAKAQSMVQKRKLEAASDNDSDSSESGSSSDESTSADAFQPPQADTQNTSLKGNHTTSQGKRLKHL